VRVGVERILRWPALAVASCGLAISAPGAGAGGAPAGLRGLVADPPLAKPRFTLTDTSGHPYHFVAATKRKLTYLYFGYTHCPDACPATMSELSYAIRTQPASVRRRVAVVFVTVDPRRDTRPVLRRWLDHYGRSFVGLRGSLREIGEVEHEAGVPTAVPIRTAGTTSYQVEHSSFLFAYSPDGRSHVVYTLGFKPADYAHDLPLLLRYG